MVKVLVVDDEKELIDTVETYLSVRGYDVASACNGVEGIEKTKAIPNIVLLDITMPGLDGFDVLQSIRGDPETRHIAVIMLTAKSESSSIFKAQDLGATDYIIKPFKLEELLALIRKYTL